MRYGLIELPNVTDARGNLTVGEFGNHIPFDPKRYFLVYQVPLVEMRGEHAHRECHQFLVCVRGRISVVAALLVFASHHYDADDYIRDHAEFLRIAGASA